MKQKKQIKRVLAIGSILVILGYMTVVNASSIPQTVAPEYEPGKVLVKFRGAGQAVRTPYANRVLRKKLASVDYTVQKYPLLDIVAVKSDTHSTSELIEILDRDPAVEMVIPNYVYTLNKTSDTYYDKLWAIENTGRMINYSRGAEDADMDVNEAWQVETGDTSVVVAVLDTGIDYTHPDLAGNMWNGLPKHGYDFAADIYGGNDDDPMPVDAPYHWHGTHVAGTIGAVGDNGTGISGVAQNVSIMALKVFRPNLYAYENDILEAINFILERIKEGENVVAVNASYGSAKYSPLMVEAIKKLGQKGVIFSAAAGNERNDNDKSPRYPASYDIENIISVAASDQKDRLASFSNYGLKTVDIAAPGVNIYSTVPGNSYRYASGTSMAAPHISGAVALLASRHPDTTILQRKKMILAYSDQKPDFLGKLSSAGRANLNEVLLSEPDLLKAVDDYVVTRYETVVTVDVVDNDLVKNIDSLSIRSFSPPLYGRVSKRNGKIIYTPNRGFSGKDSFRYTVTDGYTVSQAVVHVLVKGKAIHIPDDKFAKCVKKKLKIDDVLDITRERVEKITRFRCEERFSSITGIEYFKNLKKLHLTSRNLSDISPLERLENLTSISIGGYLGNGRISDLSALSGLKNLTYLDLYSTRVSDLSPLRGLKKLETLRINNNRISDLSPLTELDRLKNLSMDKNSITDLSPLSGLKNLSRITADDNNISNLSPLGAVSSLRVLSMKNNNISDLSVLSRISRLWSVILDGNNISDLSPLKNQKRLRFLLVSDNRICDFSPVSHVRSVTGKDRQECQH